MKYLLIVLLSVATLSQINAQKAEAIATALETAPKMEVISELLPFNKSSENGFTVYIKAPLEAAQKSFKEYLETKYMIDVKKSKNTVVSENVVLPEVSKVPLFITAIFLDDENGCKMNVFYSLNGSYISLKQNSKEAAAITANLKEYQKQLYVKTYQETLEAQRKAQEKEQKALEKLAKEGEGLAKDVASEEADINKAEQGIIDSEKRISELQAKIQELRGEIEQSRATIEELREASSKKQDEIEDQTRKVSDLAARIARIKASSDKLGN